MKHALLVSVCLLIVSCIPSEATAQVKQAARSVRVTGLTKRPPPAPAPAVVVAPVPAPAPPRPAEPVAPARLRAGFNGEHIVQSKYWNPIEMSFHLLPTLSWNTGSGSGAYYLYESPAARPQFNIGANVDFYFFRNRYAFGTGVWYTVKSAGFVHKTVLPDGNVVNTGTSSFNVQYLQIPLTVKLMSDGLFKSGRAFVQYGVLVDFKLAENARDRPSNVLYRRDGNTDQFSPADFSLLLSMGYMHRISRTNEIMMTLQYQRGLVNVASNDNLRSVSNMLGLGAGMSF